jgi:hypothetical protein
MAEKPTHFGRAGEFFAMSELLLRGWNVAVPVVDVGDDVFVIDDNDKTTYRVQVKSATSDTSQYVFKLSRKQLRTAQAIELFYLLLLRDGARWRFLALPREQLMEIRDAYESDDRERSRGRPPVKDTDAKGDDLSLRVSFDGDSPEGWGRKLAEYLDTWPDALPEIGSGPGARGASG